MGSIVIIFYCEFGNKYGYGHLMRCLSLSQAFDAKNNIKTVCFSKSDPKGLNNIFINTKIEFINISLDNTGLSFDPYNYLGLSRKIITVFDNYDVTEKQMINYRKNYSNLVAIDDVGDRIFDSDIIVNQNLGSNRIVYKANYNTTFFLGEKYALLRNNILNAKRNKETNRIFMSFGGGEVYDRIENLLFLLLEIDKKLDRKLKIDFVISGNIKSEKKIIDLMSNFHNITVSFIINQLDLAPYMEKADFSLNAAGSTVYELAALGVPQLVFIIDNNQEITGNKINQYGFGNCLGYINNLDPNIFKKAFLSFLNNDNIKKIMSRKAMKLIDGYGAKRVANGILNYYGYS